MNKAFEIQLQALQQEVLRQQIFLLAITLLIIGVGFWLSYLVIRAAIRDGIRESGLVDAVRRRGAKPADPADLPNWAR